MGRKRIYKTKEEVLAIRRKRALDYYYNNQEKCKKKRMERYYGETANNWRVHHQGKASAWR